MRQNMYGNARALAKKDGILAGLLFNRTFEVSPPFEAKKNTNAF
jgi:hypothetical protein